MRRKSSSFYKFFVLMFNLLFVISSLVLLCVGLVIRGQYHRYHEFLNENYFSLPFMLICVSTFMLVITFFGCCGAMQDSSCMIWMFAVMLGILFIAETTIGFTAYALSEQTHNVLKNSLNDTMKLYSKSTEVSQVWDQLQENLQCCGVDSYKDWYPILNNSIPMSCCEPQTGAIGQYVCNESVNTLHRSSCLDTLASIVKDNASTLGAVGIGVAICQVLGVIISCKLSRRIRENYENFD